MKKRSGFKVMARLIGLVKPLSGNIEFGVGSLKIGYLPQQTELQRDFPASVKEIVMSGFAGNGVFHPFYSKKEKETARRFAERLGISKLWQCCYRELSGGQQQRVLLARALCASGNLLLLDEPAAALDTEAANEMYELISSVNRDGTAVIMVTHDIKSALKYSNLILKIGNEIFFGTNEEFLQAISEGKESE